MSYLPYAAAFALAVLAYLKYTAPKTKNTLDDKVEAALEAVEPTLEAEAKK